MLHDCNDMIFNDKSKKMTKFYVFSQSFKAITSVLVLKLGILLYSFGSSTFAIPNHCLKLSKNFVSLRLYCMMASIVWHFAKMTPHQICNLTQTCVRNYYLIIISEQYAIVQSVNSSSLKWYENTLWRESKKVKM